jgi:hypothetical protein
MSKKELEKAIEASDAFDKSIKDLTMDRMNEAPKQEVEPQTKMSQKDITDAKDIYLKPVKSIGSNQKFNEKYREDYNFSKEYVRFIAEHKELIGCDIEIWTRPFGGMPAEYWEVPTNKPVWGPRYLAEQIKRKYYHRLKSDNRPMSSEGGQQFYGAMTVDTTIQRLDAQPCSGKKSIFMGASF